MDHQKARYFRLRVKAMGVQTCPEVLSELSVAEREIGVIGPLESHARADLITVGRKPRGFESHPLRRACVLRWNEGG